MDQTYSQARDANLLAEEREDRKLKSQETMRHEADDNDEDEADEEEKEEVEEEEKEEEEEEGGVYQRGGRGRHRGRR